MCRRVTCGTCGKPGFAGCGRHVEQVLAEVPAEERCRCREERGAQPPSGDASSILKRMFGL